MVKKNGYNKFANTAIISGAFLVVLSILAFLYINGDTTIQRMIVEFRSEVFGVAVGIFVIGVVAKYIGVKLGWKKN